MKLAGWIGMTSERSEMREALDEIAQCENQIARDDVRGSVRPELWEMRLRALERLYQVTEQEAAYQRWRGLDRQ